MILLVLHHLHGCTCKKKYACVLESVKVISKILLVKQKTEHIETQTNDTQKVT